MSLCQHGTDPAAMLCPHCERARLGPDNIYPALLRKDVADWKARALGSHAMSDYQDTLRRAVDAELSAIHAKREELVRAWIAETGLQPSDSMLVVQRMDDGSQRTWVQRREELPPTDAERAAVVRLLRALMAERVALRQHVAPHDPENREHENMVVECCLAIEHVLEDAIGAIERGDHVKPESGT